MMKRFAYRIVLCLFPFFGLAQTLTINSSGQNGPTLSNISSSTSAGTTTWTVTGAATISATAIQNVLSTSNLTIVGSTSTLNITFAQTVSVTTGGKDLILGATNNSGAIAINENCPLTINGKLTVYGSSIGIVSNLTTNGDCYIKTGYIDQGGASTTNTNGGDLIYWTTSTSGNYGYIRSGTIITNGGHVWMGGSWNATAGTHIWNGHVVGGGYALSQGFAGVALRGSIDTRLTSNQSVGGDVLLAGESGTGGVGDVHAESANRTVNTGNGAIVLMPFSGVMYPSSFAFYMQLNTTGKVSIAPASGTNFWSGINSSYNGTTSSNTFTGTQVLSGIQILNFSSLGGLELGMYSGTGISGDTHVNSNSSIAVIDAAITIAGPIRVQGSSIQIVQNLQTTASGSEIRIVTRPDVNSSAPTTLPNEWILLHDNRSLTTNNGNVILWANSSNKVAGSTSNCEIMLGVNSTINSNGGKIVIAGGLDNGANGGIANDGIPDGFSYRGGYDNFGLDLRDGAILLSGGGDVIIRGEGGAASTGIRSSNNLRIDSGTGTLTIFGKSSSSHGINFGIDANNIALTSASTNVPAVSLTGITTANSWAINFANSLGSGNILVQSTSNTGGGVHITGTSAGNAGFHNRINNGRTQILSKAGKIRITTTTSNGTNGDFAVRSQNGFYIGQRFDATAVNSIVPVDGFTGDVTINAQGNIDSEDALFIRSAGTDVTDSLIAKDMFVGAGSVLTAYGKVIYQPFSTSFSTSETWPINNLSVTAGLKGLRIGKPDNTANITISGAQSVAGSIAIFGGQVTVNADLICSTIGDSIFIKASDRIDVSAGTAANAYRKLQTNNGNVVLWSNCAGSNAGGIRFGDWSTINTANGLTNQNAGGGKVWMAGGTAVNASGLPTGPANGTGNNWTGISFGSFSGGATTTSIYSGGGNIYLCGEGSNSAGLGISWNRIGVCNSGNGTIQILGESKTSAGAHGVEFGAYNGTMEVASSGGDANNVAIYVKGTCLRQDTYTGIQASGGSFRATGAGGVYIEGVTVAGNTTGQMINISMDVLSVSGPISLVANGPKDLRYYGTIGRNDGNFPASSSNVLIRTNALTVNSTCNVKTSGTLTIEPFNDSFTSNLSWPINSLGISNDLSGLTLGKGSNTANITFASATSIAGPIAAYGGQINVNANLSSTLSGAAILLQGSKIVQNNGTTVQSNAGNITYTATNTPWTATSEQSVYINATSAGGTVINAQGGNISINGSFAATGVNNNNDVFIADVAVLINNSTIRTSGQGTLSINGNAYNNSSTFGAYIWGVMFLNTCVVRTENGALNITGTGSSTKVNSRGIIADNINLKVLSSSGTITLTDAMPTGHTLQNYSGPYFRPSAVNAIQFGADGSLVTSSSSNIIFDVNEFTFDVNPTLFTTSGTLTIRPVLGSFLSAKNTSNIGIGSAVSGFTLGKTGNTANLTVSSDLSVNGPITLHGGTLALNGNLTTTSSNSTPSNISLNGSTITGTPTLTLATGSTLTMNLSSNTTFGGSLAGQSMSFVKNGAGVLSLSAPTALTFIDFTISGGTYRLNSNQQLTLSGALTNNGTFTMRSGATFVPSATVSNISGSGTYNVQRLLTGNESNWNTTNSGRFWYMGVPVNSTPRSSFGTQGSTTNRVWSYSESSKQYTEITSGTDLLSGGTGYVHRRTTNDTLTFSGVGANGLRGSAFTQSNMTRTSGASVGFHLVSNPYMAYVDWDAVTKTNIESTYYIRSAATGNISALISYNAVGQNYVNGGVSNITSAADVRYLAPMQAFWVRVGPNTGTGSLGMNTGMLSHQTNNPGLKSSTVFPTLARVNLVDGARFDQMLVFMNQDMSNAVDQYDSEKMFVSGAPQIYTMAAGKKLVMNGLRDDKKKVSVPLYLELPTTKSYELHLCEYQIEEGVILLEDKQEGVMIDFSLQNHYVFEASSGVLQNRFVLHFILPQTGQVTEGPSNSWAAAESPSYTDGADILIASDSRGKIQISVNQAETQKVAGTVAVTDANGKVVYNGQLEGLFTEFELNVPSGIYYLTVRSGNQIKQQKVFVQG